jgi:hypothetical protein
MLNARKKIYERTSYGDAMKVFRAHNFPFKYPKFSQGKPFKKGYLENQEGDGMITLR